jgi:PhzF family phenazine biosynthesis protein
MNTMQNERPLLIYDCFSNQKFGGNVGGIVLNAGALKADQMQIIAREVNAAVTGFVTSHNGAEVSAKFFMPGAEIAMCGHVVVGLFSHLYEQDQSITEYTLKAGAGDIRVRIDASDGGLPNVMMQLCAPTAPDIAVDMNALSSALGIPASSIGLGTPVGVADAGLKHICVHFDSISDVQNLTPDFKKLGDVCRSCDVHTVACFSMETENTGNTLHIRDFCPALGVDEVPASGTTNAALAGYLIKQGLIPAQSQMIFAEQGAEIGRPSRICSEIMVRDGKINELWVGGQAVASIKGVLLG